MNVTGIDHVVLYVEDVRATAAFYADLFDAETEAYAPDATAVRLGPTRLNLRPVEGEGALVADVPTAGAGDVCLLTDWSADDVVRRLQDRGVDVLAGPVGRSGARGPMTSVYYRDPEGNLIEVARYGED